MTREHFTLGGKGENLPPAQRNPGTGYVGFRPAENRKTARKRRASTVRAEKAKVAK
jgi:hypothetical protein